jgi:glutathione-regulated potassium-efflux system ancillary protein KefG
LPPHKRRVLVLFAHPALERSRVNRPLAEAVQDLDDVTFNDLYESYPDFDIDVEREQRLLVTHDVIIFQHPFYWYSTPAIIKEWQDLVLEHGWAYGSGADALRNKVLMNAITTGGTEATYCHEGSNRCTMRELLLPIAQTAALCGMTFLPPFVVHGTHELTSSQISEHAVAYRRTVAALRDGTIDLEAARPLARLNSDLTQIVDD